MAVLVGYNWQPGPPAVQGESERRLDSYQQEPMVTVLRVEYGVHSLHPSHRPVSGHRRGPMVEWRSLLLRRNELDLAVRGT